MDKKESKRLDCRELLDKFLNDGDAKKYLAMRPTTRHEAWLLGTTLALLNLLEDQRDGIPPVRRRIKT